MSIFEERYKEIIRKTLDGTKKKTRQGVDAFMSDGDIITHDMSDGFPLITLRKIPLFLITSEVEFFLKGKTDKRWLQERGSDIYTHWCNPQKVPYGSDSETKKKMRDEPDLGPINGFQWRHFGANYRGCDVDYTGEGVDQIKNILKTLKENPESKRMVVSAWNPVDLPQMSIPPCPFAFQVTVVDNKINLSFYQRSVDLIVGFPFDIAHYAVLLHLFAKETGYKEGILTAHFGNLEIYTNHIEIAQELLERKPKGLSIIKTPSFDSIFEWKYDDSVIEQYMAHPAIKIDVVV